MAFEVLDEHEQGELVRKWLRSNALSIAIGIGIGLLLIFGYQQWQAREARTNGEAAMQFAAFTDALDGKRDDDAARIAETLRTDYAKSSYAVFAALRLAETAVVAGDLDKADSELDWAEQAASEPTLKSLIALRKARISLARGEAEKALSQLDKVAKDDFSALASELRGDTFASLGRTDDARAAYADALTHLDPQSPNRNFVEMKLNDLPAAAEKQKS
ncbi:YfgM family protein [Dokdonella sp.]|uniref:YfgM family protein n=1 Tax=Dokdonella sp. TaxID=2291710 RepID=UPI0035291464